MHEEASFIPLESDISRYILHPGRLSTETYEVVGLDFEIDAKGYCRIIYSSGDAPFSINNVSDVELWLGKKDPRTFFVADNRWLDSLLKWFGSGTVEAYAKLHDGVPIRVGSVRINYQPPNGFAAIYSGRYKMREVRCLKPFYHMSGMLPTKMDCFSVETAAKRLVDSLVKYEVPGGKLKSVGSVFKAYVARSGIRCSSVGRVPKAVLDMASQCYHTNLIVAVQAGRFKAAWDYDISGAYSYHCSNLLSCDPIFGDWIQSSTYHPNAFYGFVYGEISCRAFIAPLLFRRYCAWATSSGRRIDQRNLVGSWLGFATKDDIDFLRRWGVGDVKIISGWWFLPRKEFRPFEGVLTDFFDARRKAREAGDRFSSNQLKLDALSSQGCFLSSYMSYEKRVGGYMRNPVYASKIVAATRCQVGDLCMTAPEHLIHIAVDGAAFDKKLEGIVTEAEEGQFRLDSLEGGEEMIVAGDGEYWRASRPSVFQKATLVEYAGEDFYPDLVRWSPRYSYGEAVVENITFEQIGTAKTRVGEVKPGVLLGHRAQRLFGDLPRCNNDLLKYQYVSLPRRIK